jgi:TolB-like protein
VDIGNLYRVGCRRVLKELLRFAEFMPNELYVFDRFTLDVTERRLTDGNRPMALEPKTFDVLTALVRSAGRLVGKRHLLDEIWPGSFVAEGILSVHVARLRTALGGGKDGARYIETVPRSGYRFVATPATVAVPKRDEPPSIAVLPFADLSAGKDHEWFSDGLSEEIINALTHVPGLKVIARTSAFTFRGGHHEVSRVASALHVRTILEGSVRRAGDRIRVTAKLISAQDGCLLWSERYDRELTDIFAIQDDIARAIASALQVRFSDAPSTLRYTPTLPAYDAYLKGRHYLYKLTAESMARSRQCFEQAIDLDPAFVVAHVGLTEYFFTVGNMGGQNEAAPRARLSAQRALDLDPATPHAHALLAMVASTYDFNWSEVDREFRLAMASEPVTPFVRDMYGAFYLLQAGRVEEGGRQIEQALREDPLNLLFRIQFGIYLLAAGKDADAATHFLQVLEMDPNYPLACIWLCVVSVLRGLIDEARRYAEQAFSLVPSPLFMGVLAGVARRGGDRNRAEQLVAQLQSEDAAGTSIGLALHHLMCLEIDEALAYFETAIARHDAMAMLPVLFRRFCASSPRWPSAAKALNLRQT